MSRAKRGDRVPPPAPDAAWDVRFGTNDASKGWGELAKQAAGNTAKALHQMRTDPSPAVQTPRQHRLKGRLSTGTYDGRALPLWQIEVTGAARVWYLVDEECHTVWVIHASPKHPKVTGG